jgi:hypothetical protein
MDKAIEYANLTAEKLERIGVKDFRPGSSYEEGDYDSASSLDGGGREVALDLEVLGLP